MDDTSINYFIKLQGKANIPLPLKIGNNYKLVSDASIISENKSDNEDGTYDVTYKVMPVTIEISKDNGEVVKAKDTRKNSVLFRKACWMVSNNNQIDDEKFYDFATKKCLSMLDALAEEFKKL